jgi:four helix bundle protein
MAKFRFEDLEIWKEAISIAYILFQIADDLEAKRLFRFADQVRGVGMSIPNNISESTGTDMLKEQRQLLRYSKRECYEAANILVMLRMKNLITEVVKENLFERLDVLARRTQNYSKSLGRKQSLLGILQFIITFLRPMS